ARLGPHLALVHALLVPAVDMRREFGLHEAARLLFEQDEVFGHPGRAGKVEDGHVPAVCRWWVTTELKMALEIHPLVQNTDHLDAMGGDAEKEHMRPDGVFTVAAPNLIAWPPFARIAGDC